MSLKVCLLNFLSRNTLSRKHDVGVLFTWAELYKKNCPQNSKTAPVMSTTEQPSESAIAQLIFLVLVILEIVISIDIRT